MTKYFKRSRFVYSAFVCIICGLIASSFIGSVLLNMISIQLPGEVIFISCVILCFAGVALISDGLTNKNNIALGIGIGTFVLDVLVLGDVAYKVYLWTGFNSYAS